MLAASMAENLDPSIISEVKRVAFLCKADLVTGMVGEFPELQGVMGREYARLAGEKEDVAQALLEHYLPRFAGDVVPRSHLAALVGIADRLDTIVGCFGVGLVPTGTADPYGLRRHALGILNILMEKRYSFFLPELIEQAKEGLGQKLTRPGEEVTGEVLGFIKQRLFYQLTGQGFSYDVVDAVLTTPFGNPVDAVDRVKALDKMKKEGDFEHLAVAFKRVVNIISGRSGDELKPAMLVEEAERDLHRAYLEVELTVRDLVSRGEYGKALREIARLRGPVDCFFDQVLVMAEDVGVKENRLALLKLVASLFAGIADFSKIVTEGQGGGI
jgi:glycyl-tRNA synthetase beta chain